LISPIDPWGRTADWAITIGTFVDRDLATLHTVLCISIWAVKTMIIDDMAI
jgi:hypothetical protein